jgi:hypothetical protein
MVTSLLQRLKAALLSLWEKVKNFRSRKAQD